MSYDIHQLHIPDDSPEAREIEAVITRFQVTPEEAVLRILRSAVRGKSLTPAQELVGAFSSPEDAALLDKARASVREHRQAYDNVRNFGV